MATGKIPNHVETNYPTSQAHEDHPVPKAPFPTNEDAETASAEKLPKGDPPFLALKGKGQDGASSKHNADPEDSKHSEAAVTDSESENVPQQVQTPKDDSSAPATEDTDGQADSETVEAQPYIDGVSKRTDEKAGPRSITDKADPLSADSGDAAIQNSADDDSHDDPDNPEVTVEPTAGGAQQGQKDEDDTSDSDTDDDSNENERETSESSKGAKSKKKKKSDIKRSLKDDALNAAVDKTVEAMRSIETGGKIKLSKIRKLCSCSNNPARKVYGKALSKVGRFIGLDESEENENNITKPNVNQRGANIPPSFLDELFEDYDGTHPYQPDAKLNCVRVNEVDLLVSVQPKKEEDNNA